jgi:Ca2+-binding RTX toxin-like protein
VATDPDTVGTLVYSLTGADAGKFGISPTGAVTFKASPNFESPTDAGGNNIYDIVVNVTDGVNAIATKAVAIAVTDVNDAAPVITTAATQSIREDTKFVAALTSTDVDTVGSNPPAFAISGGADLDKFAIVSDNLVFKTAPDFEAPLKTYHVEVSAFDGTNTTLKAMIVNVSDIDIEQTDPNGDAGSTLTGTNGKTNYLSGLGGDDTLVGKNKDDELVGGTGNDTMTGAGGNDTFVFASNFGKDRITDFAPSADVIEIDHTVFATFAALIANTMDVDGNAIITADVNNTITLNSVSKAALSASDFHLV